MHNLLTLPHNNEFDKTLQASDIYTINLVWDCLELSTHRNNMSRQMQKKVDNENHNKFIQ